MIHALVQEINRISRSKDGVLIAIDGVGGAGKTTLAEFLRKNLQHCSIVQLDDFYSPSLQAADLPRLKEQVLLPLQNHQEARYRIYEWKTDAFSDWHILKPEGIIIFEGVYALDKNIRDCFDLKIWIDYPANLGFRRGIARDILRDGIDQTDKWKNVWMPLEEKYVIEQQPKASADYVVDGAALPIERPGVIKPE
jgi:uridine kinase